MTNYIKLYKNAINRNFCETTIKYFEENKEYHISRNMKKFYNFSEIDIPNIYNVNKSLNKEIPNNTLDTINHFYSSCSTLVEKYVKDCKITEKQFPEKYNFENCRIKKYDKGIGYFSEHVDVRNYDSAKRFLVLLLYLNSVEIGGKTVFPAYNEKLITPNIGDVLIFPSTWTHLHQGMKPISEDKYILGTYLHYC